MAAFFDLALRAHYWNFFLGGRLFFDGFFYIFNR